MFPKWSICIWILFRILSHAYINNTIMTHTCIQIRYPHVHAIIWKGIQRLYNNTNMDPIVTTIHFIAPLTWYNKLKDKLRASKLAWKVPACRQPKKKSFIINLKETYLHQASVSVKYVIDNQQTELQLGKSQLTCFSTVRQCVLEYACLHLQQISPRHHVHRPSHMFPRRAVSCTGLSGILESLMINM